LRNKVNLWIKLFFIPLPIPGAKGPRYLNYSPICIAELYPTDYNYYFNNNLNSQWGQGGLERGIILMFFNFFFYFSKPLCNKCSIEENIKTISVHVPRFTKPTNDNHFSHYLAGLIEGDGCICKNGSSISIAFNTLDAPLAYYIKKRLKYGNIYKVKNKNAVVLSISHTLGIKKVVHLINGKIRTENKFNQLESLLNQNKFTDLKDSIDLSLNKSNDLDNY
jgi:hypothetical protein